MSKLHKAYWVGNAVAETLAVAEHYILGLAGQKLLLRFVIQKTYVC